MDNPINETDAWDFSLPDLDEDYFADDDGLPYVVPDESEGCPFCGRPDCENLHGAEA